MALFDGHQDMNTGALHQQAIHHSAPAPAPAGPDLAAVGRKLFAAFEAKDGAQVFSLSAPTAKFLKEGAVFMDMADYEDGG